MSARIATRLRGAPDRQVGPLAIGAAALCLGAVVVLAYILVPQATVVIHPTVEPVVGTIEIRADPALRQADLTGARVPARVSYVIVDVKEQALTAGRLPAADAHALGTVTLVNRQGGQAPVPAGSIVTTPSGLRFQTTAEATLDPAPGATARVPIRAAEPGEKGNVERLEINRLVGSLAGQVAALNEEPTVGGGQSATPMIVEADVARVRQLAADRARADAMSKLTGDVRPDESLVLQTFEFTPLEEQLDRRVGELASTFNYRLRARVSGSIVSSRDLESVVHAVWRPSLPPGYVLPPPQLQIRAPQIARVEDRSVVMRLPVQSVAIAPLDAESIRERVRWRPADEARRELMRTFKLASEPRVAVEPRWASRALRIKVVFDLNEPKPSGV